MKNEYTVLKDAIIVHAKFEGQDTEFIIDHEALEKVKTFPNKWHVQKGCQTYYVYGQIWEGRKATKIYLHQFLVESEAPLRDHKNGNGLDNRYKNIRPCTSSENGQNKVRPQPNKTSKYRGVSWDKARSKWTVSIKLNQKAKYLGRYLDEDFAGKIAAAARSHLMPFSVEGQSL